jgi:hypothetical protein
MHWSFGISLCRATVFINAADDVSDEQASSKGRVLRAHSIDRESAPDRHTAEDSRERQLRQVILTAVGLGRAKTS